MNCSGNVSYVQCKIFNICTEFILGLKKIYTKIPVFSMPFISVDQSLVCLASTGQNTFTLLVFTFVPR